MLEFKISNMTIQTDSKNEENRIHSNFKYRSTPFKDYCNTTSVKANKNHLMASPCTLRVHYQKKPKLP